MDVAHRAMRLDEQRVTPFFWVGASLKDPTNRSSRSLTRVFSFPRLTFLVPHVDGLSSSSTAVVAARQGFPLCMSATQSNPGVSVSCCSYLVPRFRMPKMQNTSLGKKTKK